MLKVVVVDAAVKLFPRPTHDTAEAAGPGTKSGTENIETMTQPLSSTMYLNLKNMNVRS